MKIVIFGANEIGCLIATELFEDHDITVIDNTEDRLEEFSKLDIGFIYGSGSDVMSLEAAQIRGADLFIACTDKEEANIVACIISKSISNAKTICFIGKEEYIKSLAYVKDSSLHCSLAVDHIIWPQELLTQEIFRIITIPNAIDVENFADGKGKLLEYRIKEDSSILNKKIKDCNFPQETLIVGITRDFVLFIPDGETTLKINDKVIFMGSSYSLDILAGNFFSKKDKIKDVTIIGGGSIGLMLAQKLENLPVKIKIIEQNYRRCEYLSEILKKTLVINGDGTDLEILENENLEDSEAVVCVTNNDEKNLLCSLLAKQLDVRKIITRVSKQRNANLFEKVGSDVALSPNSSAINEIKNSFIQTDVEILATVERGQGKVIEVSISEKFDNTRIMDIRLPQKAIIAIIQRRNTVIIPKGNTHIMSGDNLIIFTRQEHSAVIKEYFCKI